MISYPLKILLPVDFSDCSVNALRYGIRLAKNTDSKVKVLHSYHVPIPSFATDNGDDPSLYEHQEEEILERLGELKKTHPEINDVPVEFKAQMGFFADTVAKTMQDDQIDLIVMGTTGTGGPSKLLGSNTWSMISSARCPIITVPPDYFSLAINYICFATDLFSMRNLEDLYILKFLSLLYNAKIYFLNVSKNPDKIDFEQSIEALSLHDYFQGTNHEFCFLPDDKIDHGIGLFVEKFNIDLLVMRPGDHNWLGRILNSYTRKVMSYNRIPLMTIHK